MPSGKKILKSILILTGNHSDADVVALFDAGADDCISKPCTSEVLLARMGNLLRRSVALSAGGTAKHSSFTATEYNLLELLRRNPDRIFQSPRHSGSSVGNGCVCCVRDPSVRSDDPIDPRHSADSESFAFRAKFAQMAVAGVITKPIQPLTLTEEVAEILGWVD